jgi:PAS domain S-box-containing protein
MAEERKTRHSSANEVAELRRRVADLERANERLRRQLQGDGRPSEQSVLENINDIVYTTDLAGNVVSVNRAVKRTLGFDPEEVIGTHYGRWLSREDFERLEAARPEVLKGKRRTNRAVLRDQAGQERQVEISVGPLMIEGRIEGTQGIIRDVTAQQRAEQGVRASEEKLRVLLDAVNESLLLVDSRGTILTLNQTAARRLGRSTEEMIGRRPTEVAPGLMPTDVAEWREALIRQVFETGAAAHGEDERLGVHFDTSLYPVFGADGKVASVAIFAKDVTEHKQLEQKLRESEERYRTVVETAGETIVVVDAQGVFQFLNATAGRRLGGPPADFIGKTMWELFPKDIADRQVGTIRRVIQTQVGVNTVVPSYVGGQMRWYNTTVEPWRDSAGQATAALVIARDIHELRTAQQELETYREKMIRAEHLASLGTLSAMLSHEMMQPLTVIRLSIQNALETLAAASVPPTVREDLDDGLAGVSEAAAIVERFRDFARRTSDKKVEPVSLAAVARRVVRLLEEGARKARMVLDVSQLDELPALYANAKDVEQVFFALAQNAVQAASDGQRRCGRGARDHSFRVVGACRGDSMELQFVDDCGGIAPEIVDRVFDPFVTTKPAGEGTGLGLCVVHRIVSQAGGHVTVNSRWGEGTTFFVTLPIGGATP